MRVLIQNEAGHYLAGGPGKWYFTEERAAATIFHYLGDKVAEQLEVLRQTAGAVLEAVPVPMEEVYEICDGCKEFFAPVMVFFDGRVFLCADCRSRRMRKPSGKHQSRPTSGQAPAAGEVPNPKLQN